MAYADQDFSVIFPEYWAKKFLKNFDEVSVMAGLVNQDYEGEIKDSGDTVHVSLYGDVTFSTYTRNSQLVPQELTITDNTMVIDQEKVALFGIDDLENKQSHVKTGKGWRKRADVAAAETIDSRLLTHYANANASNVMGSTTDPLVLTPDNVYDYFIDMGERFDNQGSANMNVPRNAVITPKTRGIILKSPELRDRGTKMVDETIRNGKVGKFAGWDLNVTTNISTVSNSNPHMFLTPDFISFAMQLKKSEQFRPFDYVATFYRMVMLYGSKVFTETAKSGGVIHVAA